MAKQSPLSNDFLQQLGSRYWFRKFRLRLPPRVNILGLNLREKVPLMLPHCVVEQQEGVNSDGNMIKTLWNCGNVRILDLTAMDHSDEAREELGIILRGEAPFGKPMRPSGWFSYHVLGRMYARDEVSFDEQPHAVLYEGAIDSHLEIPLRRFPCNEQGIEQLAQHLEEGYFERGMKARDQARSDMFRKQIDETYRQAFKAGKAAGLAGCKESREFKELLEKLERCENK